MNSAAKTPTALERQDLDAKLGHLADLQARWNTQGTYEVVRALRRDFGAEDDETNEDDESNRLPEMRNGEKPSREKIDATQHFTEPPPRFSDGDVPRYSRKRENARSSSALVGSLYFSSPSFISLWPTAITIGESKGI